MDLSNPKAVADHGEKIYQEKYKSAYESEHPGQFLAIDVTTEKAYLGDSAEAAINLARNESPTGLFHLVKVGSAGAFRVSYTNDTNVDWLFR